MMKNNKLLQGLSVPLAALQLFGSLTGIGVATSKLVEAKQSIGQSLLMLNYECIVLTAGLIFLSQCLTTKILHELYFDEKRLWMQNGEMEKERTIREGVKWYTIVSGLIATFLLVLLAPAIVITLGVLYRDDVDLDQAQKAYLHVFYASIAVSVVIMILSFLTGVVNFVLCVKLTRHLLNDEMGKVTAKRKSAGRFLMVIILGQGILSELVSVAVIVASLAVFVDYYMFIFAYGVQRVVVFLFTFSFRFVSGKLEDLEGKISKDINVQDDSGCCDSLCCCFVKKEPKEQKEQELKNV